MKKIIYLMAAFAALTLTTACNEKKYVGSEVEITLSVYLDGELAFEDKDVEWELQAQKDGSYTLFMNKTRFVEAMPMLDMEVRGLTNQSSGPNEAFHFQTESIIPYYKGNEFDRYVMTDFSCVIRLTRDAVIEFNCAGYHVVYTEVWADIYE